MGWRDEALERLGRGEKVDRITALLGIDRRTLIGLGHANGYRFDSYGYGHRARQAGDTTDARDLIRPHLEHPDRKVARAASRALPLLDRLYADLDTWTKRQTRVTKRAQLERELRQLRGPDHATVRRWARAQGLPVPSRGTVPQNLIQAYLQSEEAP